MEKQPTFLTLHPAWTEELVNWAEWTEQKELRHLVPCQKLNWQPTRSGRQTEPNKLLLNNFELNLCHSDTTLDPGQTSMHAQQSTPSLHPGDKPRAQAGISARGDLALRFSTPPKQWETRWAEPGLSQIEPARSIWVSAGRICELKWMNCTEQTELRH